MEDLLRILIVDDDASVLGLLIDGLGRNQAYQIAGARDGYEGLTKVGTFRPHLLILDLQLPGLDGFEVCRKVKAGPVTQSIKVLAISASPPEIARERILEAGADGFLEKPFRLEQLEGEVSRLLGTIRG